MEMKSKSYTFLCYNYRLINFLQEYHTKTSARLVSQVLWSNICGYFQSTTQVHIYKSEILNSHRLKLKAQRGKVGINIHLISLTNIMDYNKLTNNHPSIRT